MQQRSIKLSELFEVGFSKLYWAKLNERPELVALYFVLRRGRIAMSPDDARIAKTPGTGT